MYDGQKRYQFNSFFSRTSLIVQWTFFSAVSFYFIQPTTEHRQYSRHKRIIDSSLFILLMYFENGMHLMSLIFSSHTKTHNFMHSCMCCDVDATIKGNKTKKKEWYRWALKEIKMPFFFTMWCHCFDRKRFEKEINEREESAEQLL